MKRALVSAAITAAAVTLTAAPAFASPAPSATASTTQATYTVRAGDSFWSISQRYGVTMANLAAYNNMSVSPVLFAGVTLYIPTAGWSAPAATYTSSYEPSSSSSSSYASSSSYSSSDYHSSYSSSSYSAPSYSTASSSSSPSGVWSCIAQHESSGNPSTDTGNGYYGMYQFTMGTWEAAGGTGNPADASAAEQTAVAQRVQQQQGWGAWPVSSSECGV